MKLALADRDIYYADPLFAEVPLPQLLSPQYAELRRPLIDRKHASLTERPGDPRAGKALRLWVHDRMYFGTVFDSGSIRPKRLVLDDTNS